MDFPLPAFCRDSAPPPRYLNVSQNLPAVFPVPFPEEYLQFQSRELRFDFHSSHIQTSPHTASIYSPEQSEFLQIRETIGNGAAQKDYKNPVFFEESAYYLARCRSDRYNKPVLPALLCVQILQSKASCFLPPTLPDTTFPVPDALLEFFPFLHTQKILLKTNHSSMLSPSSDTLHRISNNIVRNYS